MTPKLSILIPTYNRRAMLRECLESALQCQEDCEILVVDNASQDGTAAMMAKYVQRDSRIRYVHNAFNIGATPNFQRALREARGKYLCLMGDDDSVLPGNFEKKAALLDANLEIGFVYSLWRQIDEHSRDQGTVWWAGLLDYSYIGGRHEFMDLLPASYIMNQTVLFRRTLWQELGDFDKRIPDHGADWDMWLRYCYFKPTAFIAEPLVNVRVHSGANSTATGVKQGLFASGKLAVWRRWLVDNDPPIVLDDRQWQKMIFSFQLDLQCWFGNDSQRINSFLTEAQRLCQDHLASKRDYFDRVLVSVAAGEKALPPLPRPVS